MTPTIIDPFDPRHLGRKRESLLLADRLGIRIEGSSAHWQRRACACRIPD